MSNFNFKKKFGQNFLQDTKVIDDIITSVNVNEDDLIIEIGPGSGALTKKLVKYNSNFIAYEIDEDTKKYLLPLENDKQKIIYDNFIDRDIINDVNKISYNKLYVVANLPYYITTPILLKFIEIGLIPDELVVMVQNEVADRFSAKPSTKDYGSITVFLNYFYTIHKLFIVTRDKFFPVPGVDSAVIKLEKKEIPDKINMEKFTNFVKDSFQFKRKNLRNNLANYDRDIIESILNKHNLSLSNRAEDISVDIFVELVQELTK